MARLHHLGPDDSGFLSQVRPGTFDNDIDPAQAAAFLADPGHEIVVACAAGEVVGFASGTVLLHPDKPPAFFIAEVSVHEDFRRRGLGSALMQRLIAVARGRGCKGIWLATEADNDAARGLYRRLAAQESEGIVVYDWDGVMPDAGAGGVSEGGGGPG